MNHLTKWIHMSRPSAAQKRRAHDWYDFWQQYRPMEPKNEEDLLWQVSRSVDGKPIGEVQFNALIEDIVRGLQLQGTDRLLDLCCGNGVLTNRLSHRCADVLAIDFAIPFIATARRFYVDSSIDFQCENAVHCDVVCRERGYRADKVLLCDAFGSFDPQTFDTLLCALKSCMHPQSRFMISSISDINRQSAFYNTLRRKWKRFVSEQVLRHNTGIGRWWSKKEITTIAKRNGYGVEFLAQSPDVHTSHYRFDCVLHTA